MSSRGLYNDASRQPEQGVITSRGYDHTRFSNSSEYINMVYEANLYYGNMRSLRLKFKRDLNYYMGRQLEDEVVYNGHTMTVHDYMEMKGMAPLSSDIITDKMVPMKGMMREQYMAPEVKNVDVEERNVVSVFNQFLRQNDNNNNKAEHNADQFEAHLCMGFIVDKVKWAFRKGREDVYVDAVDPFKIAVPVFGRKDLEDIEFIAEAHDMTWPKLLQKFYRKPSDEKKLQEIYTAAKTTAPIQGYNDTGMSQVDHLDDFLHSSVVGKYRVIEIWRKEYNRALWCHDRLNASVGFRPLKDREAIDAENEQRKLDNIRRDENGLPILDADSNHTYYIDPSQLELIEYEPRIEELWYYRFLSPNGYLLDEGVSPYKVLRDGYSFYYHPYVFLAYPCLQGEVRSFEDRIIDKQRQYNHDNILLDFIIMNSAKGSLAIDTESIDEQMDWTEIAENYVKVDGVILYTSKKGGNVPQQIQNKSIPAGIDLILQRDKELVTSQSGVQPALQGVTPQSGTSGLRYRMQRQGSATSVEDYFGAFNDFQLRVAHKQLWTIQQFYDSKRSIQIAGEDFRQYFNPETMGDADFDMTLTLNANSAVIREQLQELVFQAYQKNEIEFGQMLDCADFGDTAKLKRAWEDYKQRKLEMAQQQAAMGAAPTAANVNRDNGSQRLNNSQDDALQPAVGTPGISA